MFKYAQYADHVMVLLLSLYDVQHTFGNHLLPAFCRRSRKRTADEV
jgi:hypothetical protein